MSDHDESDDASSTPAYTTEVAEVYIKQEVDPPHYVSEGEENDSSHETAQENYGIDPDYSASEDSAAPDESDGSDSSDPEYQVERPTAQRRRPAPRSRRRPGRPKRNSNTSPNAPVSNARFKKERMSDTSDGEITESETTVGMTRILHDAEIPFNEVERSRQCFVVLEILPGIVNSRGLGTVFTREELKSLVKGYGRKRKPPCAAQKADGILPSKDPKYNPRSCPKCGKIFSRPDGLRYHMKHMHIEDEAAALREMANRKYVCETCGKRFTAKYRLDSHNQVHTKIPIFPCRVPGCERKFRGSSNRSKHEQKCTGATLPGVGVSETSDKSNGVIVIDADKVSVKHPVPLCRPKPNFSMAEFAANAKQRRKVCRYCRRTFATYTSCHLHELNHKGIKPYQCTNYEGCSAAFNSSTKLVEHVRIAHTGEKPYKCSFEGCGEEFAKMLTFKRHISKHFDKNKYVCPKCGREFASKQYLKLHELRHTGYKPFLCTHCGKSFYSNYNLQLHSKVHNKPPRIRKSKPRKQQKPRRSQSKYDASGNLIERPYPCTEESCDRAFTSQMGLQMHRKISHGIQMNTASFQRSQLERPYNCTQTTCDKTFVRRRDLHIHLSKHHGIQIDINQLEMKHREKRKPYAPRKNKGEGQSDKAYPSAPCPPSDLTQQQQHHAQPPQPHYEQQHHEVDNSSYHIGNILNRSDNQAHGRGHRSGYEGNSSYMDFGRGRGQSLL